MGNSGLRKIFYPGDVVENKYRTIHEITVIDLDKNEVPLSQFQNKVCLVVNVGSQHSDAPSEMQSLKQLQQQYGHLGFQVLAFPTNQFTNEPGNYRQVKECYDKTYDANFPVFGKVGRLRIYNSNVIRWR